MSELTWKFLAVKPGIRLEKGCLFITTPKLLRVLYLGLFRRTVEVNPPTRQLTITHVFMGRKKVRKIPFADVQRLEYRFSETAMNPDSPWLGSQDSMESFTVALILKENREEVLIARFWGEGSVDHGWLGRLNGDDWIDARGDQEESSLAFVRQLRDLTGFPLT